MKAQTEIPEIPDILPDDAWPDMPNGFGNNIFRGD